MKKFASILLVLCMILGMTAVSAHAEVSAADIKIGMICIGDENEGYSANHINGLVKAAEALGIAKEQIIFKYNTPRPKLLRKLPTTSPRPAATSSSPTPSAMRATLPSLPASIPRSSSATPPVPAP